MLAPLSLLSVRRRIERIDPVVCPLQWPPRAHFIEPQVTACFAAFVFEFDVRVFFEGPTEMNLECCKTRSVSRPGRRLGVGLLSVALLSIMLAGCSEAKPDRTPVFPAKGTITFKGQPVSGALVALHPKTPTAGTPNPRANVEKDGAFKVSTYVTADGAPEGDYTLTVLWYKPVKKGTDVVSGPNVIPAKYANPNTSDLVVNIKPGDNDLPAIAL